MCNIQWPLTILDSIVMYSFNFLERSVCLTMHGLLYTVFIRGHHTRVFYQDMIVVVKTNIDITFANSRCFDLSVAEFMTFIILSYEMSVV